MFHICSFLTLLSLSAGIAAGYLVYPNGTGALESNTLKGLDLKAELLLERLLDESADKEEEDQLKRTEEKPGSQDRVNGFKHTNRNNEEGFKNLTERKIAQDFENRLKDLERKYFLQENKLKEYERKVETQNEMLREQTRRLQSVRQPPPRGVAFSTQLTETLQDIAVGTKIKFDQVDLNDGNGYDKFTGVFRAPQSGVYIFTYFVYHGGEGTQSWIQLEHNGRKINAGVVDSWHEYQDTQGGNTAIISLEKGDDVWLEAGHNDGGDLYPDGLTTFCGALLYYV